MIVYEHTACCHYGRPSKIYVPGISAKVLHHQRCRKACIRHSSIHSKHTTLHSKWHVTATFCNLCKWTL